MSGPIPARRNGLIAGLDAGEVRSAHATHGG